MIRLSIKVPLVAASLGKGIHHSTVIRVSDGNWSFQLVLQLYGPSILWHFFLNHHSKKLRRESHQHPPQLQSEITFFTNYIGSIVHIVGVISKLWQAIFIHKTLKQATRKLHTKRTSSRKPQTLHFFPRDISKGAWWFHSRTNGMPDISRRLLFGKESLSMIIHIPYLYLINIYCFARQLHCPNDLAIMLPQGTSFPIS